MEGMGYAEALAITLDAVSVLGSERVELSRCPGRVLSADLYAKVSSPSTDASLKDGYAVRSGDVRDASPRNRVRLRVIDTAAAGCPAGKAVTGGTAIRILTGATIPEGADAVLSEEFADNEGGTLSVFNDARPGRNILPKGTDVAAGDLIASRGNPLDPGLIGLLAAGGHCRLPAYRRPKLAIFATGDELVKPGQPLGDGKLYASNLEMLKAWCRRYGMRTTFSILNDRPAAIAEKVAGAVATHDAVLTSGGAWFGDRDFVSQTLDTLGWKKLFHRIRMGPGKAVGFGMLHGKPVFLLPGGPPSNLTAFLQIALPGLLRLAGHRHPALPRVRVKLSEGLTGRHIDWTEFVYGRLTAGDECTIFHPHRLASRLRSMAEAEAVIAIPEGSASLAPGAATAAMHLLF